MSAATPARQGEVWFADLDPISGAGRRPVLIISVDQLGTGPSQLAIAIAITSHDQSQRIHVKIEPPEGGIRTTSYAMPEQIRTISRARLIERWGQVRAQSLEQVIHRVHLLTRAP